MFGVRPISPSSNTVRPQTRAWRIYVRPYRGQRPGGHATHPVTAGILPRFPLASSIKVVSEPGTMGIKPWLSWVLPAETPTIRAVRPCRTGRAAWNPVCPIHGARTCVFARFRAHMGVEQSQQIEQLGGRQHGGRCRHEQPPTRTGPRSPRTPPHRRYSPSHHPADAPRPPAATTRRAPSPLGTNQSRLPLDRVQNSLLKPPSPSTRMSVSVVSTATSEAASLPSP